MYQTWNFNASEKKITVDVHSHETGKVRHLGVGKPQDARQIVLMDQVEVLRQLNIKDPVVVVMNVNVRDVQRNIG